MSDSNVDGVAAAKIALRIRVELDDGRFIMVPVRIGVTPRTQAELIQRQYAQPTSIIESLTARIQTALDDAQQHQSNSRRLLRDGVDAAQDVAELSYREFPLRLGDTDDDDTGSDSDTGQDDGWEPKRSLPIGARNIGDDVIVHVMINDHDEAVLTVRHGVSIASTVDEFVAKHQLSASKRQILLDHVMAQLPVDSTGADTIVCVVTVMIQDRFLDRLEIRADDDLVQRLQEFSDRNEFTAAQRRRLTAIIFVNMERVELSSDRDRCPSAFIVRMDAGGVGNLDDVLCDDDLMSMLDVDKVLAFCDRRQVATRPEQRHALVQAIDASRQSTVAAALDAAINDGPIPCLSLPINSITFDIFPNDDLFDQIGTFADHHLLGDNARLNLVVDVLRALSRAESRQQLFDADAIMQFVDRHCLCRDRQSRLQLIREVDRVQSHAPVPASPARPASASSFGSSSTPRSHNRSRSNQSEVFHRLYAEHLIRKRKTSSSEPRLERKPSSARSVICDRLYTEGLKYLHRRSESASAVNLSDDGLTFRPQIRSDTKRSHRRQFSSGRTSSRTQQRQVQYLIERQQQELSACTFRPEIHSGYQPSPGPVYERLYRDGQIRSQRQATLQAVAEELRERRGPDYNHLDRLHNHNLYKKQAIDSFRKKFHDFDADGNRLFHISDYMKNSTPRMDSACVANYLHSTLTQASRPTTTATPACPNPIEARSNAIVRRAVQSRLRRLYSALVHDGLIDGLSVLRIKSDQSQIPEHLRSLVINVITEGTREGQTMNFDQFVKSLLQTSQRSGLLPSDFIQARVTPSLTSYQCNNPPDQSCYQKPECPSETPTKKSGRKSKPNRDVFSELYCGSQTLRDRRFVLQYKAMALQSARDRFDDSSNKQPSGSQTAR